MSVLSQPSELDLKSNRGGAMTLGLPALERRPKMKKRIFKLASSLALLLALGFAYSARADATVTTWNPSWFRMVVDNSGDVGAHSSIAINPKDNAPYVTYFDGTNGKLKLAVYGRYLPMVCQNGWNCTNLEGDGTTLTGSENSMVIDSGGNIWIAYTDPALGQLTLLELTYPKGLRYPTPFGTYGEVKYPSVA